MVPNPVCSSFWETPVVFHGRVIERTLVRPPTEIVRNSDGTTTQAIEPGIYRVRFAVSEMFRGDNQAGEITIETNEQSSACGFNFRDGGDYVVFAYRDEKAQAFATSHCTRTREVTSDATDVDLLWMRGLATAPHGGSIFGVMNLPPKGTGTQSPRILLHGPVDRGIALDAAGKYSFDGLPAGEYTISAKVPDGFRTTDARKVTLLDKGCAEIYWPLSFDSHVGGTVTDTSGTPIAKLMMQISIRDLEYPRGLRGLNTAYTDVQGRYDFAGVSPGDYVIAANEIGPTPELPYPLLYFGDTEEADAAAVVHLQPSATIENINFTMPAGWKKVPISTRVVLPNGMPATGADVSAYDTKYPWSGMPATAMVSADGSATVEVYAGRSYYLVANQNGVQQHCAGPVRVVAKSGLPTQSLVIEHNWGNCLAQLNPKFKAPR